MTLKEIPTENLENVIAQYEENPLSAMCALLKRNCFSECSQCPFIVFACKRYDRPERIKEIKAELFQRYKESAESQKTTKGFYVMIKDKQAPKVIHDTYASAHTEAKRLLTEGFTKTGSTAVIMEIKTILTSELKIIEE